MMPLGCVAVKEVMAEKLFALFVADAGIDEG